MLKYNGSILKLPSKAIVDYTTPPDPLSSTIIGTQKWTNTILTIDDGGEGIITSNDVIINGTNIGTVCYYTKDAAARIVQQYYKWGWRIPSSSDIDTMVNYIGGYNTSTALKLKYTSLWSNPGTNDYDFNAIPCGMYEPNNTYRNNGTEFSFWGTNNYRMYILNNNSIVNGTETGDYKFMLRFVKDVT